MVYRHNTITQFLAPKRVILDNLGQKWPAKRPNVVLPEIKSYPDIAWDMGTENLPRKPPVQISQHKKILICLIFTTFFGWNHFWTHYTVIRCRFRQNTFFSETPCISLWLFIYFMQALTKGGLFSNIFEETYIFFFFRPSF